MPLVRAEFKRKRQHVPDVLEHDISQALYLPFDRDDESCEMLGYDPSQVLYLPFDGDNGSHAIDRSGYNNHGTIYGATHVPGRVGYALKFDGVDDYVRIPDAPILDITTPFTILTWIYVTKLGVDQKIFHHQSPGIKLGIYTNNKVEVEIRNPSGTYYFNRNVSGGTTLTTNKWYFVGGWWNGSEMRSIVNGVFERPYSYTGTIGVTSNDAGLGCEYDWSHYFFNGIIDELRVYNRALSQTEIQRVMNACGV